MFRNKRLLRSISIALAIALLNEGVMPCAAWALTSGPSQPEMQQFTPISSTDYVDLFTGDFSYNIPLLDVEGFPINLAYHSGITADQEASWVGLGWNINPGVINRQVRGIPDDFKGDITTQSHNIKPNITVGLKVSANAEIFGYSITDKKSQTAAADSLPKISLGLSYNNYRKLGTDYGLSFTAGPFAFDIQNSSQGGLTLTPSLQSQEANSKKTAIELSAGLNSREGLQDVTLGLNIVKEVKYKKTNTVKQGFGNVGYPVSFAKQVFYPSSEFPMENLSFSFTVKPAGGELFGLFPNSTFEGYYYTEYLKTKVQSIPSFGWLYEENGSQDDNALMDFEREKDVPFRQSSVNLPIPYASFDIFDVSGNDVEGSYHIERNDLGVLRDRYIKSSSLSASGGIDFGIGGTNHIGGNIDFITSSTITSGWNDDNLFKSRSVFTHLDSTTLYEPAYFKNAGEMTLNQGSMFTQLGFNSPAAVSLLRSGTKVSALAELNVKGIGGIPISSTIYNSGTTRIKRQQVFSYLNGAEASLFGLEKNIRNFALNSNPYVDCNSTVDSPILRYCYPPHHISEITILKDDGRRYVYGIPAYNTYQKEVTFSAQGDILDVTHNLIYYSESDATAANNKGKDHFFDSKIIPPYAHSYLLTAVLSSDYQDNTGDGVTPDDLGQAYKLNYSRALREYKWRAPVQLGEAQFNEGMKSETYDDKGSYVYGKKEIWYLNSVESRNYIAVFYLKDRDDGLGVAGESGGTDVNKRLKYLDHIDLYSKADLIKNKINAIPIKSAFFEYDYSLCRGVPNQINPSTKGKLTLRDIYFTCGKSMRGKLNKYVFSYDDGSADANPGFSQTNNDRWGNYASYKGTYAEKLDTFNFPYTVQDVNRANQLAGAWALKKITLPSSGILNISYESDSYAYIQNKRAGQMTKILGFSDDSSSTVYDNALYSFLSIHDFLFIRLPKYVHSREQFRQLYLDGLDNLYYQMFMNVNNTSDASYEFVKGYTKWVNYGIKSTNDSTNVAWLKLAKVSEEVIGKAHPFSFAAWQYLRLNLPEKAFPGSDLSDNAKPMDYVWAVMSILPNLRDLIFGFNNEARLHDKGKIVDTAKSLIRLDNPTFNKLGGGSRVKRITLSDNWSAMVNNTQPSFQYGQDYSYTKEENNRTISSGVASYEPIIGNEENPFRVPVFYVEKNALAPNNFFYSEEPLGESLFPSPVVGYSEVRVRNIPNPNVTVTGPGFTISKFYTARDYPVIYTHTDIDPELVKPNPIFKILNINVQKSMTASQGFSIEVNDMHGKLMEEDMYNEEESLISSKQYHYKNDDEDATIKHLNNSCEVVTPNGTINSKTIGMDFEAYADMRHQENNVTGGGLEINTEVVYFFLGLIPIPSIYPSFTDMQTLYRASAITKFVKRYGILEKITVKENGATITTQNVLYDSETGSPVLIKVNNEFSDPIYKFTYPVHWILPNMGFAYKNDGAIFKKVTFTNGAISLLNANAIFVPGDEVAVYSYSLKMRTHGFPVVYASNASGSLRFLTKDGALFNNAYPVTIKIIRSGYRNMMNKPVGAVSSLIYPVTGNAITFNTSKKILNADAVLYSELWRTQKNLFTLHCDSLAPPDTSCGRVVASAILNSNLFQDPQPEQTVEQFLGQNQCSFFQNESYGNQPFAISSESIGEFPYQVTAPGQYPGITNYFPTYVNLNSFLNIEALLGSCTFYFINTSTGPLPVPPPGFLYYSFKKPSDTTAYPPNAMLVYYSGPRAYYMPAGNPSFVGYFYIKCMSCQNTCKSIAQNDTINPYALNILGAWRPQKSFAYHDLRNSPLSQLIPSVENDGSFANFSPFYTYNAGLQKWVIDSTTGSWIRTGESTMYDFQGNEIQSKDALNIPGNALYGYNHSLPVAVVHNAQLKQAANDNFEDYNFKLSCAPQTCDSHHWDFSDISGVKIDTIAHTGNHSLKLKANKSAEEKKSIISDGTQVYTTSGNIFKLGNGGLIPEFSPTPGKYLFSAWVKVDTTADTCYCKPYWGNMVKITMQGSGTILNLQPSGPVIETWQRIQGEFNVASNDTAIKVKLIANPNNVTHFDDIRIFPTLSNMKSFVYDERTLRLMATLDENNYATFYEYDEDGNLIRIKKETERGIVTVQETRAHLKREQQ